MDYKDRKAWQRRKDGSYCSCDGSRPRFTVYPVYNRIYGGDCWKLTDSITGETDFRKTFTDCRTSASRVNYPHPLAPANGWGL